MPMSSNFVQGQKKATQNKPGSTQMCHVANPDRNKAHYNGCEEHYFSPFTCSIQTRPTSSMLSQLEYIVVFFGSDFIKTTENLLGITE